MEPLALPFTLHPSRVRSLIQVAGTIVLFAGGVFLLQTGHRMGWVATGLFGFVVLASLVQLLPGAAFLTVDQIGFEFCTLFKRTRVRWAEVSGIGVFELRNRGFTVKRRVGFNYASDRSQSAGAKMSRNLFGWEATLPDNYALKADDLALLLRHYHARCALQKVA